MIEQKEYKAKDGSKIYLAAIFALIFFQILFSIILSAAYPEVKSTTNPKPEGYYILSYIASICFQLGYLAVFIVYLKAGRTRPQIFIKHKIKPVFYVAAIIAPFACLLFFFPASHAFDVFLDFIKYQPMEEIGNGSAGRIVLMILAVVVLAPVCEELIYRSALTSGLDKRFSSDFKGMLICVALGGAAFSLMHMSPRQTIFQFFLGGAAVILVLTSRSVIPSIILHFINNLIVVLASFFEFAQAPFLLMEDTLLSTTAGLIVSAVLFTAAGIAAFLGLWVFLKRYSNKDGGETVEVSIKDESKGFYAPLLLGLGICAAMWISQLVTGIIS